MLQKKQFVTQLKKLVSIPSLSGNQEMGEKILDLIESWAHPKASKLRIKNHGAEILLLSTEDLTSSSSSHRPKFGYLAHADVVSAQPSLWQMKIEKNKARGRGVSDMKYAIPIGLALLEEQMKASSKKRKSFTLAITTDEELGGFNGARHLAEKIKFHPEILIVPDGGDNWKFVEKEKGFLRLELHTYGENAHGSQPWDGKNAISDLIKVLAAVDSFYAKNNAKKSWNTTCNIGVIQGGSSVNQVPNHASAILDIRHTETETHEEIQETISKIAEKTKVATKIVKNTYGYSRVTEKTHPVAKQFIKTMQKYAPKKIQTTKSYGASDARHFSIYEDLPVLMMKPNGGGIHQDSEWIDIDECLSFARGLSKFVKSIE